MSEWTIEPVSDGRFAVHGTRQHTRLEGRVDRPGRIALLGGLAVAMGGLGWLVGATSLLLVSFGMIAASMGLWMASSRVETVGVASVSTRPLVWAGGLWFLDGVAVETTPEGIQVGGAVILYTAAMSETMAIELEPDPWRLEVDLDGARLLFGDSTTVVAHLLGPGLRVGATALPWRDIVHITGQHGSVKVVGPQITLSIPVPDLADQGHLIRRLRHEWQARGDQGTADEVPDALRELSTVAADDFGDAMDVPDALADLRGGG